MSTQCHGHRAQHARLMYTVRKAVVNVVQLSLAWPLCLLGGSRPRQLHADCCSTQRPYSGTPIAQRAAREALALAWNHWVCRPKATQRTRSLPRTGVRTHQHVPGGLIAQAGARPRRVQSTPPGSKGTRRSTPQPPPRRGDGIQHAAVPAHVQKRHRTLRSPCRSQPAVSSPRFGSLGSAVQQPKFGQKGIPCLLAGPFAG